jgi:hypothetical protein
MYNHLDLFNLLSPKQHGFRKGRSCETALSTVLHEWVDPLDQLIPMDVIFLDFAKAFDRVPHRRLMIKLHAFGFRGLLARWIAGFLCHRNFSVRVDGKFSQNVRVRSGVPQGTVLGPLLFTLFINDIVDNVSSSICLYADDVILYRPQYSAPSAYLLQYDIDCLVNWSKRCCLQFNISKCKSMRVQLPGTPDIVPFQYAVDGSAIEKVAVMKYLGVHISSSLKWGYHISMISKKASVIISLLRRNFCAAPSFMRRKLYVTLVRPIVEYCGSVWDPFLKKDARLLEAVQNRGARFVARDFRFDSSVTAMKLQFLLEPLDDRRMNSRVSLFVKYNQGKLFIPGLPLFDLNALPFCYAVRYRRLEAKNSFVHRTVIQIMEGAGFVFDDMG